MTEKTENVINFTLSKDIYLPITIGIHDLSGITPALLLNFVNEQNKFSKYFDIDDDAKLTTDVLIRYKMLRNVWNKNLLCEIHLESGNGKKLTIPIVKGLSVSLADELPRIDQTDSPEDTQFKFKCLTSPSDEKEWIQLPINYNQLPLNSMVIVKLFCIATRTGSKIFIGEGNLKLFNTECSMKMGKYRIPISVNENGNSTNLKKEKNGNLLKTINLVEALEVNNGRQKWLTSLTDKKLNQLEKNSWQTNKIKSDIGFLIELPNFESPVIYSDVKYTAMVLPSLDLKSAEVTTFDSSFNEISYQNLNFDQSSSYTYPTIAPFDPDTIRIEHTEDPVEQKFRRLERIQHFSPLDKESKPTIKIRIILSKIMAKQFFEKISAKERNIVWKYRWFLLNNLVIGNKSGWNNFTVNFIKCVDWNNESEVKDFESILKSLSDAAIKKSVWLKNKHRSSCSWWVFEQELEIIDCLELLTGGYRHKIIRKMAVNRLLLANDDDLAMFMVQLVQNIKYEVIEEENDNLNDITNVSRTSEGNQSINEEIMDGSDSEERRSKSISSSTYTNGSSDFQFVDRDISRNDSLLIETIDKVLQKNKSISNFKVPLLQSPLVDFLIKRAIQNPTLTYSLYWCLKVESEEEESRNLNITNLNNDATEDSTTCRERAYEFTMKKFILKLAASDQGIQKVYDLRRQIELVKKLHDFCIRIKFDYRKESTPKKVEILKHLISDKQKKTIFSGKSDSISIGIHDDHKYETMIDFPAIAMPMDPKVIICGSFPEESSVFKSSLSPIKICFKTIQGLSYPIMYKIGDDLRQDQFITQIISLMEKILGNENMDLKLRPYKILATGPSEGFIQFIPNSSLSSILARYNNSILSFLQASNPDENSPLGVKPEVMDNYVRSCAGYCVVTYILGIGDRHLENLLLSPDGHFFHADFGYILGQDPKPFPPLMKLPIQIIEGMGGLNNDNYKSFCQLCFITYITLRKNASLILNLVQLMINTSIPALFTSMENNESEKQELLWKVQEKFMLDMSDEEAVLHFQNLIDDSVNAVLPVVIDRLHSMAQYWRA